MPNEIQQPKPFDFVGNPILIGGIGSGFEATLQFRVHDGHDERTGHFNAGGGTGEHGQFQISVDVTGPSPRLLSLSSIVCWVLRSALASCSPMPHTAAAAASGTRSRSAA